MLNDIKQLERDQTTDAEVKMTQKEKGVHTFTLNKYKKIQNN